MGALHFIQKLRQLPCIKRVRVLSRSLLRCPHCPHLCHRSPSLSLPSSSPSLSPSSDSSPLSPPKQYRYLSGSPPPPPSSIRASTLPLLAVNRSSHHRSVTDPYRSPIRRSAASRSFIRSHFPPSPSSSDLLQNSHLGQFQSCPDHPNSLFTYPILVRKLVRVGSLVYERQVFDDPITHLFLAGEATYGLLRFQDLHFSLEVCGFVDSCGVISKMW